MMRQNKRGGRVKLRPMVMPQSKFDHAEKGDVLYGFMGLADVQLLFSTQIDSDSMYKNLQFLRTRMD
ncbi:hypothetical protein F2Q68_00014952 [Brassica cretica]|uniref:Uncharacterized protein n=2 Tax=Brassica cretica TaxID=69181 RepID=A0ABQ7F130_BRACR|nr:hypothetical protein F2Q68_00014952 [Brassica cretica]KAF3609048.1 hypothetical protein DY000_02047696 [Brassica cretica]